jgi:hypothetical protein
VGTLPTTTIYVSSFICFGLIVSNKLHLSPECFSDTNMTHTQLTELKVGTNATRSTSASENYPLIKFHQITQSYSLSFP